MGGIPDRIGNLARRMVRPAALMLAVAGPTIARADAPMVRDIQPIGLIRGETVRLTITGERIDDAREIHAHNAPGLKFGPPNLVKPGEITIETVVAPDCPPGEYPVRLRSATGWSYLRLLRVAAEPRAGETEPNNEPATANSLVLPACIEAEMKPEDVDVFAVELKKGERLTAVAESIRLGRGLLDLHLSVVDGARFELAARDDSTLLGQDPFVSIVAPADGKYFLQIRDAAYEGADGARYRLRVGSWKQPVGAIPNGGPAGSTIATTYLFEDGSRETHPVVWPSGEGTVPLAYAPDGQAAAPATIPVRVDPMAGVIETEPNGSREQAVPGASGVPVAFHGITDAPGDEDWFALPMSKGQSVEVDVRARRLGSPMDPVVDVFAPDGKHRGGNDDADGKADARQAFAAEVDGVHTIKIRDSLGSGGPLFTYRIEVRAPPPALALSLPSPELNNTQAGQTMSVPRGNRGALVFNVGRKQASGELAMELRGGPPGLSLLSHPVPDGAGQALVLFEAAADAPEGGCFADMVIRKPDGSLEGRHGLTANLVTYGNNEPIYQLRESRLPVAVAPPVPLQLTARLITPMAQGGQSGIVVQAARGEGFNQAVELRLPWKPTGVTAQPSVTLPEGAGEITYPVEAETTAALGSHPMVVTAHWGAGTAVASGFFPMVVEEARVRGSLEMLALPVGGQGMLTLVVEHLHPFDGAAEVEVLGLPPGVEASPAKLAAGQARVEIPITVRAEAPVGKHGTLFCRVAIPSPSGPMLHRLGAGGVLRIDKPAAGAPPPPPQPPPASAAAPGESAAKPLSRLEQLRQKARANP